MHFAVAASIAAFPAGCVNRDRAAHFSARRIESDRAALEFECSLDRVESASQLELDFCLRRVELDGNLLCPPGRSNDKRCERCEPREIESPSDVPERRGPGCHQRHILSSFHPKSIISPTLSDESGTASVVIDNSFQNPPALRSHKRSTSLLTQ